MKIGSLHYATHSGLGVLCKEFCDAGVITDVLINAHLKFKTHSEWYPNSKIIGDRALSTPSEDLEILENFIKSLDVLFVFESPWYPETISIARKHNVAIAFMPMYEWTPFPMDADVFITVSKLDYDYYRQMYPNKRVELLYVPTHSQVKWKLRTTCTTFLHNGGNGSRNDRNGTRALIDALPFIKSPINLKIKAQGLTLPDVNDPRVEIINRDFTFNELWDEADCFLFVERFAGLSLPLQEAHASGMLVIAGDRYPINTWLPISPLVKPISFEQLSFVNIPFQSAIYNPQDIAQKIDAFYGTDISSYSLTGREWAENNSWKVLKPKYLEVLKSLL